MNSMKTVTIATTLAMLAVAGCAAETADGSAPEATEVGLAAATISNTNTDGTWTATANAPYLRGDHPAIMGFGASFTGPTGKTRKMGACCLQMTTTACTSVSQCSTSPATLPTGGSRYCVNGKCAFRPGAQNYWCVGSPQNGGTPIGPGTYENYANASADTTYLTQACFEGCAVVPPDNSPTKFMSSACVSWVYPYQSMPAGC